MYIGTAEKETFSTGEIQVAMLFCWYSLFSSMTLSERSWTEFVTTATGIKYHWIHQSCIDLHQLGNGGGSELNFANNPSESQLDFHLF